ncbi:MAG: hypothetical protein HY894_09975 [Deltaproteobacteria bacterium]|nr:hypothetical protein [Deltaproteobacteria bacterium]
MLLKAYNLTGRSSKIFALSAAALTILLASWPVRTFISDYRYNKVSSILDDKGTDILDVVGISEETMPYYLESAGTLKSAAAVNPSMPLYHKAVGDIYFKLGRWSDAMEAGKAELPAGALPGKDAYEIALGEFKEAVRLEPANPDYHLALGMLYDSMKADPGASEKELERAGYAYPVDSQLRHAIAQHYLATGRAGLALEQARMLAMHDDSYILPDPYVSGAARERDVQAYRVFLAQSYLFAALDIAWRATKDVRVVKGIVPDTPEAKDVVRLFIDLKGLDVSDVKKKR